jgi:hypothetical protein
VTHGRRCAQKKPYLNLTKRLKRLAYADQHTVEKGWNVAKWRTVIWTDEYYIWLGGKAGRVYITRAPGEEYLNDCLVHKFKKENSIMVWGGIVGFSGQKILVIWEKDDWGTITAQTYVDNVLVPAIWPFWQRESYHLGQSCILMEDGASAHRAGYTKAIREHLGIPKLDHPASSPDLNPIENLWRLIKYRINKRNPRPTTKEAVKQAIIEEWNAITVEEIQSFVDDMPNRMEAVREAQGGHTKW